MPEHTGPGATPVTQGVALYDGRPFFERALQYGVHHGLIHRDKLDAMCQEAPKGMVQIARYFGSEYLRPELERARDRMVNLISLYLETTCQGDLQKAALSLRDHSLLSRSKGGSDMLKALIAMPQNSHFGMNERAGFQDEHIPLLAKWTLRSLPEYQAELARRSQTTTLVEAAIWMAGQLDTDASELEDAGKDADSVIRTALLARACKRSALPDWVALEKMLATLRKKFAHADAMQDAAKLFTLPPDLPAEFREVAETARQTVISDLPKLLDAKLPLRKLLDQTPAFMGRYFWFEDALAEVDHHERKNSAAWDKATGGHSDDSSLLTLCLCIATGSAPKTLLSEKAATALVRKIQKSGLNAELPREFLRNCAPEALKEDFVHLWDSFIDESEATLRSDMAYALQDALALLRRECNISVPR
jgi:hypothetical protein